MTENADKTVTLTTLRDAADPDRTVPLSNAARDLLSRSMPPSTTRAYTGDWKRFGDWCATVGRAPLPATADTALEYVAHLASEGKAPATIDRALSSILVAHKYAQQPTPDTTAARAALQTWRGDVSMTGRTIKKAATCTVDNLRAMADILDTATLSGLRDRAILVLGFALGARRSELAGLDIADVARTTEGVDVRIRRAKTDRRRQQPGRTTTVLYGTDPVTCPVRTVEAWIAALAETGHTTGPLFVRIDRHGRLPHNPLASGRAGAADGRVTGQAVGLIIKRAATAAGFGKADLYSGHSLRRGFATEAYNAGADPLWIARHAGWNDGSPTLLGYVDEVDKRKSNPLIGIGL